MESEECWSIIPLTFSTIFEGENAVPKTLIITSKTKYQPFHIAAEDYSDFKKLLRITACVTFIRRFKTIKNRHLFPAGTSLLAVTLCIWISAVQKMSFLTLLML